LDAKTAPQGVTIAREFTPWLHNAKSGLIYGVGADAAYVAQGIAINDRPSSPKNTRDVNDLDRLGQCVRQA
jgi:hypothetical protein